jgi:hypothetical protein
MCIFVCIGQRRWRWTWQFMMALLLKKWTPLSCYLKAKVRVNAGSHETGAQTSTWLSLLVIWSCLELMTSFGRNLWGWGETTVIFDPQLHARHLQLTNQFTSAFWRVPSGEVTGSLFPQTQNINHQKKLFIFWREILLIIGHTYNKNYYIWSYPENTNLISI